LDEGHRRRDGEIVTEGKRQRGKTEEERRRERNRGDRHRKETEMKRQKRGERRTKMEAGNT
jgi:hypothetical protein